MKRVRTLIIVIYTLLMGYGIAELIIPDIVSAKDPPSGVYIGEEKIYNGLPACKCPTSDGDCLCIIDEGGGL